MLPYGFGFGILYLSDIVLKTIPTWDWKSDSVGKMLTA